MKHWVSLQRETYALSGTLSQQVVKSFMWTVYSRTWLQIACDVCVTFDWDMW